VTNARRSTRVSISIKDSNVGFNVARTEGVLPWIALRSVPLVQSVALPQGDVYEGNFVVESKKSTPGQEECSTSIASFDIIYPFKLAQRIFPTRVKQRAILRLPL
jgi:hypothetical protein